MTQVISYSQLFQEYLKSEKGIMEGKMMHAHGLKYNGKVFAFCKGDKMGFRLGPDFDPKKYNLTSIQPLSPFKTKPPLKGWFLVDAAESKVWEKLMKSALTFTKTLK